MSTNENIEMNSSKIRDNIHEKEFGPVRSVSSNKLSSVTLIELAMKARENIP